MSKIPGSAHANITLGGLVIAGGAMGYFKKGSKMSLLAGMSVGGLLLGSAYLISNDSEYYGHCLAASSSGLLGVAMGQRYLSTMKFMPAGLVCCLGVFGCAYNVSKAIEWAPAPKES